MSFKTIEIGQLKENLWDTLVDESPDGWLYQKTNWIEFAQNWGSQSVSFGIVTDRGELVAVCPLYIEPASYMHLVKCRRMYTGMSGPAVASSIGNKGKRKIWKFMFDHLDYLAEKHAIDILQVRLTTLSPSYLPPLREDINPLWYVGVKEPLYPVPHATMVLNLSKTEDLLLKEMDGDCRAAINQAERAGVKFRIGTSQDDVREYHRIHHESWIRTGMTPHPLEYFMETWERFGEQGEAVFMFAEYDGTTIAGIIINVFKGGAFYWGGCSQVGFLNMRPNNFLLWSAIKWARNSGCRWFEIGLFPTSQGNNLKEYNVGKYKAQFGPKPLVAFDGQKFYSLKAEVTQMLRRLKQHISK